MLPALLAAMLSVASAPLESVRFFEGSYADALQKAASSKVPLFVDFYTDGCHWCKVLDQEVYTHASVAQTLNTKFLALKINAEKGEGPALNDQFKIGGYPTLVIVDPQTKREIDRIVGYAPPEKFLKSLDDIAAGKTFSVIKTKAESSPNDLDAWALYVEKLAVRDDVAATKAALVKVAALDPKDEKRQGSKAQAQLAMMATMESGDFKPVIEFVKKNDGKPAALEAHNFLAMNLAESPDPEMQKQAAMSFEYVVSHGRRDADTLNSYSWFLATHGQSLEKALALAQEATRLEPASAAILDTLAECFHRLGRKEEEIATEKKAIALASPEERKSFEARLKTFETGVKPESEDDEVGEDEDEGDDDDSDDGGF